MKEMFDKFVVKFVTFAEDVLPTIVISLIIAVILFQLSKILSKNIKRIAMKRAKNLADIAKGEYEKRVETLSGIVKKILDVVIWVIISMIILKKFGVNVAPLLTGAGIVGVALGFGSQQLVRDFLSGFFILIENQIRTGDIAVINGTSGLVEQIGLRTIILRDLEGTVHVFQNGKIDSLANKTKKWSAIVFDIGVAYKEDIDAVIKVMEEVGHSLRESEDFKGKIIEDLEVFGVDKFDDSAVVIKARLKTKPILQWEVGREYRKRLKVAFDKANIEIPFPQTTVHLADKESAVSVKQKSSKKV